MNLSFISKAVLWNRIMLDQKFFAGSGKNYSGSGQLGSWMIKKKTYLTKFTISLQKTQLKKSLKSFNLQKSIVNILKNFIYRRSFRNKVRVCRAILSRQRLIQRYRYLKSSCRIRISLQSRIRIRSRKKSFRIPNTEVKTEWLPGTKSN